MELVGLKPKTSGFCYQNVQLGCKFLYTLNKVSLTMQTGVTHLKIFYLFGLTAAFLTHLRIHPPVHERMPHRLQYSSD